LQSQKEGAHALHMQALTGKLPNADILDVGGSIMDWGRFLVVGGLKGTTDLRAEERQGQNAAGLCFTKVILYLH
jgi:hypothetical protein